MLDEAPVRRDAPVMVHVVSRVGSDHCSRASRLAHEEADRSLSEYATRGLPSESSNRLRILARRNDAGRIQRPNLARCVRSLGEYDGVWLRGDEPGLRFSRGERQALGEVVSIRRRRTRG